MHKRPPHVMVDAMSEVSLESLDPRIRKQVENARRAVESGNPEYAIDTCSAILTRHPGCLDVRKVLRRAQQRQTGARKGIVRLVSRVTRSPMNLRIRKAIRENPAAALPMVEKVLDADPGNGAAHGLLAEACMPLGLTATVVWTLEQRRGLEPGNGDNLLRLGEAYVENGQFDEAIAVGDHILRSDPGNGAAQTLVKDASVAKSMARGRWEQESDYREKLKSEEEAESLERRSRAAGDTESLEKDRFEAEARVSADPDNIGHRRELAAVLRRQGDFAGSLAALREAQALPTGAGDSDLDQLMARTRTEQLESEIRQLESVPSPDEGGLEAARMQLAEHRMQSARNMVERYPNDYGFRFEWGRLLYDQGEMAEAAEQFQLAQRNPKHRIAAQVFLARAFRADGKLDLAIQQLEAVRNELPTLDERKKEVLFELAECCLGMGREADAGAAFKTIYAADVGYRDVAERIEALYSQGS